MFSVLFSPFHARPLLPLQRYDGSLTVELAPPAVHVDESHDNHKAVVDGNKHLFVCFLQIFLKFS